MQWLQGVAILLAKTAAAQRGSSTMGRAVKTPAGRPLPQQRAQSLECGAPGRTQNLKKT